jgi:hypothetical protein
MVRGQGNQLMMKQHLDKKKIPKVEVIIIVVGIAVTILLLGAVAFSLYLDYTRDIRHERTTIRQVELASFRELTFRELEMSDPTLENLPSFENIETAMGFFFRDNLSLMGNEIIRFEEEPYTLVVFSGRVNRGILRAPPAIALVLFEKRGDGRYYFSTNWMQGMDALAHDGGGIWHNEDRVARDIVTANVWEPVTARINGGIPLYYGVGMGEPPKQFTILGHNPDHIIPFEYAGSNYFFWYYRSDYQFGEVFQQGIGNQSFTFSEVIELFEINLGKH